MDSSKKIRIDLSENWRQTEVLKSLSDLPIGFIDIGARYGAHDIVTPLGQLVAVMAFEPDKEAAAELRTLAESDPLGRLTLVQELALGEAHGSAGLHMTADPAASSLFAPNPAVVERYNISRARPTGKQLPITIKPLDEVLKAQQDKQAAWGEIIKLDTQGYELAILKGAEQTLRTTTVALFIETEFLPIYNDQPLFSEVESYLRSLGFSFFGFHDVHLRSKRLVDKRNYPLGRERPYWADAIFFKDPIEQSSWTFSNDAPQTNFSNTNERQTAVLILAAFCFGYIDFALELLAILPWPPESQQRLRKLLLDSIAQQPKNTIRELEGLLEDMHKSPEDANLLLGLFMDKYRSYADFGDITCPHFSKSPK
ncbi:methyltransferase, FkbM family [Maridesulfovibrio ferrireducens]|uniref:Methyltransferase, FkbM family n=1 Tax=Maridesulfovibrio ferrireducens TaxID=246191 RepID=A0A1G9ETF7_9BACT|nr:FkbM family methyltransferase [Maridesulfovibrio ferrireducens]SDK79351.1 methyltransferase, FkbM family [Maridesulfovibrio ferrireducens]